MSGIYINENDPHAAEWLLNRMAAGLIPAGYVDTRSILDVQPEDLKGYTQCHFFAGIGVWLYALRRAGWPDDRSIWSGSCPCQPFSAAGRGKGHEDERHLWPAWRRLIRECRPEFILGEQVAGADGLAWLDVVASELEADAYTVGAINPLAAGLGAPHLRSRLYFVAHAAGIRQPGARRSGGARGFAGPVGRGQGELLADTAGAGRQGGAERGQRAHAQQPTAERGGAAGRLGHADGERQGAQRGLQEGPRAEPAGGGAAGLVADTAGDGGGRQEPAADHAGAPAQRSADWPGRRGGASDGLGHAGSGSRDGIERRRATHGPALTVAARGPVGGFWGDAEWIPCRDDAWRPAPPLPKSLADGSALGMGFVRAREGERPGYISPLIDGAAFKAGSGTVYAGKSRAAMLKGYGNAVVGPLAQAFIECVMEEFDGAE